ncbi:tyrosine-type recombinase/integrase [Chromobacterium haemolyticum]|uniref:Tyr recombinase domain-containing protein n=1 Tax=Chromobacterium haemolyticum TaxID=394935 RepID=A0A1W0D2C0_9NEIS|nr:site-specific integrase [Chromobacterium haemolyticum]OQS41002.1 hypothetical protein B0T45_09210 [Chromobacterium haemolyticum]
MAVLSDTKARALRPDSKPLAHGGVAGLRLHPASVKGRGKWVMRYTSPTTGKRRDAGLGIYPDVSIAMAGKLAAEMRVQIANGIDPINSRKRVEKVTFEEGVRLLHAKLSPGWKNDRHRKQWIRRMEMYIFPSVVGMGFDDITMDILEQALLKVWQEKPAVARALKSQTQLVYRWAKAEKRAETNPVDGIEFRLAKQVKKPGHHAAMAYSDVPAFVKKLQQTDHNVNRVLIFIILTASRLSMVCNMEWSEVDWENKVWTIPAHKMKTGVLHRVPLSTAALDMLHTMQGKHSILVFPTMEREVAYDSASVLPLLKDTTSDIPGKTATTHGFRTSFRNWCSENNWSRDLAERAIAHEVEDETEAAYHRTDLLEQRRPMMQAWADYIVG